MNRKTKENDLLVKWPMFALEQLLGNNDRLIKSNFFSKLDDIE